MVTLHYVSILPWHTLQIHHINNPWVHLAINSRETEAKKSDAPTHPVAPSDESGRRKGKSAKNLQTLTLSSQHNVGFLCNSVFTQHSLLDKKGRTGPCASG